MTMRTLLTAAAIISSAVGVPTQEYTPVLGAKSRRAPSTEALGTRSKLAAVSLDPKEASATHLDLGRDGVASCSGRGTENGVVDGPMGNGCGRWHRLWCRRPVLSPVAVADLAESTGAPVYMPEGERDRLERYSEFAPAGVPGRAYTPDHLLAGGETIAQVQERWLAFARHPVTTPIASVAQRSISTNVTSRLRSSLLPCGSFMPSFCNPSIAMRTPSTCPAHRWPWACSASRRYSSRDFMKCSPTLSSIQRRAGRAPNSQRDADATFFSSVRRLSYSPR